MRFRALLRLSILTGALALVTADLEWSRAGAMLGAAFAPAAAAAQENGRRAAGHCPATGPQGGNQPMCEQTPVPGRGTFVQTLQNAPFPYSGKYEDTRVDFFDGVDPETGQRFHTNRYGDRLTEKDHYSDGRVLFHVPPHFDPLKPFAFVLFFHGFRTDITASARDHELTRQIDESGKNVILVAPQLARDAVDSSPGKLLRKDGFRRLMGEVGRVMGSRMGQALRKRFDAAPILLTAFSGGYKAVAYILDRGGLNNRVRGVFLMDALYEDVDKFERWVLGYIRRGFLVSLHTRGSCEVNMKALLSRLAERGIRSSGGWPRSLAQGGIHHRLVETGHMDIPLLGPPRDPLACLLRTEGVLETLLEERGQLR
jgi:hypothetical protein